MLKVKRSGFQLGNLTPELIPSHCAASLKKILRFDYINELTSKIIDWVLSDRYCNEHMAIEINTIEYMTTYENNKCKRLSHKYNISAGPTEKSDQRVINQLLALTVALYIVASIDKNREELSN